MYQFVRLAHQIRCCMLYNGKCTDTTDLGCCFTEEFYNVMGPRLKTFEYSCNMETGHNCTLTTKKDCFNVVSRFSWDALYKNTSPMIDKRVIEINKY